jgi:tRNA dimethylallyltransferase
MDAGSTPQKTVIVIAGPTAIGKTAISIQVAQQLHTEILSADSRQCYREITIGTAKPSAEEVSQVKHHFIDEFPAAKALTAADYESLSLQYLDKIFAKHDVAVVCGGTGLYIKALCEGLDAMPEVSDDIVHEVNEHYRLQGLHWLQDAVHSEDPEFFAQAEVQNPARLIRALAFKRSTGESLIHFRTGVVKERPFNIIKIALQLPREVLYERINQRVDIMMQQGLLEEVKSLLPLRHLKNLHTVGYTELFDYLDDKYELDEAVNKIKQNTRNYAKRQMTWFRRDTEFTWLDADATAAEKIVALYKG